MTTKNAAMEETRTIKNNIYSQAVTLFANRSIVTIATGATCAYLGDERNLREFLIADETARHLRAAGHTVFTLLIDDSMDPLNMRQLRVAVNKDETLIQRYAHLCGKPISTLPDPWGCHDSFAAHFEAKLLNRLHGLDCHPALVSTASLYQKGMYAPYVRDILERYDEVLDFLRERFADYTPDKLFWVLCPDCKYIDETRIEHVTAATLGFYCRRCERSRTIGLSEVQGKFNWKLDCALRWSLFKIDAEPFTKAYLEPQTGSFVVAQALSERFFGGHPVLPLHYGTVKMDRSLSYKLLDSLPAPVLRTLFVERPTTDLTIAQDLILATASRLEILPDLSYFDFVRQLLPVWLLTPESLNAEQRALVSNGITFSTQFLNTVTRLPLPRREDIVQEDPEVLGALSGLIAQVLALRQADHDAAELSAEVLKPFLAALGASRKPVYHRLRYLVGQEQGLPVTRLLSILPLSYLQLLVDLIGLHLATDAAYAKRPLVMVAA